MFTTSIQYFPFWTQIILILWCNLIPIAKNNTKNKSRKLAIIDFLQLAFCMCVWYLSRLPILPKWPSFGFLSIRLCPLVLLVVNFHWWWLVRNGDCLSFQHEVVQFFNLPWFGKIKKYIACPFCSCSSFGNDEGDFFVILHSSIDDYDSLLVDDFTSLTIFHPLHFSPLHFLWCAHIGKCLNFNSFWLFPWLAFRVILCNWYQITP